MRSIVVGALAAAALLFAASNAVGQRDARDRADRGQRLDSDAFRNDMLQNQQRKPAYQPYLQAAPAPVEEKPKRSQRKRKAD
jgi:hypothetical protein